jgi:hypothetical protein
MENENINFNEFIQNENSRLDTINLLRNGRVDIMGQPISSGINALYDERNTGNAIYYREALNNIAHINPLQEAFFSETNIEVLQTLLSYHINLQSEGKYQISRQDDNQLKIIMKSIYLQFGKNLKTDITEQVKVLNSYVLDYSIPNIIANIEQYIGYKKHVSTMPTPLEHPVYTSKAGTRTNPDFII